MPYLGEVDIEGILAVARAAVGPSDGTPSTLKGTCRDRTAAPHTAAIRFAMRSTATKTAMNMKIVKYGLAHEQPAVRTTQHK